MAPSSPPSGKGSGKLQEKSERHSTGSENHDRMLPYFSTK